MRVQPTVAGRSAPRSSGAVALRFSLVAILAVLVVGPLVRLVSEVASGDGSVLDVVRRAVDAPGGTEAVRNTILFALGSTVVSLVVGAVLAYATVVVDVPFRRTLIVAAVVPMAIPGFLYAFSWILLLSPRSGVLAPVTERFGLSETLDPFSLPGMIWIEGLHVSTIAFLLFTVALRSPEPDIGEAARLSGASRWQTTRRITLPLARPAIAATSLVVGLRAVEAFEIPGVLGLPAGVPVVTTQVFALHTSFPGDTPAASALSLGLVGFALVALAVSRGSLQGPDRFAVLSGQRRRRDRLPVRRHRSAGVAVLAWATAVALAPLAMLVWTSLLPFFQRPSIDAVASLGFDNFREVSSDADFVAVLVRTVALASMTATIAVAIGLGVSWWGTFHRTQRPDRLAAAADGLTLVPLMMPGLVLGLAISLVWVGLPVPVYGTAILLIVGFVTGALPYGARYADVALRPIAGDMDESARLAGASALQRLRRLVLPLAAPGLAAAWLTIVMLTIRELSVALLLYTPGDEVLAVLMWERFEGGRFSEVAALGLIMLVMLAVIGAMATVPLRRLAARTR